MLQSIDTVIAFVVIMTVTSLFVTIVVQIFSAALSLRGKNLANALALTFQSIAPSLDREAHQLAARILSDPLLSDSTRTDKDTRLNAASAAGARTKPWHFTDMYCGATRLASAVRPDEVYATLKRLSARGEIATGDAAQGDKIQEAATAVLKALTKPGATGDARSERSAALAEIHSIAHARVRDALLAQLSERGSRALLEIDLARAKFDGWFGSAQDRAQQWFQLHTRGLTIGASILVAIVLQLDAIEVFHLLSTDSAARNALVASADRVLNEAGPAADAKGGLLKRIADAWEAKAKQRVDISGLYQVDQLRAALAAAFPDFDSAEFEQTVTAARADYFKDQRAKLSELAGNVGATGFQLVPVDYWRWPSPPGFWQKLCALAKHLPGIALFAGLLTLGAPYWYNLLKNLTSLRPALAQLIGREEKRPDKPS